MRPGVVIVGASHAGVQVAISLREQGYEHPITLINGEVGLPYQKPPLSKGFVSGHVDSEQLAFRSADFFEKKSITLLGESWATKIHRVEKKLAVKSNVKNDTFDIFYDHLVLATGASAKKLEIPGEDLSNVISVRDLSDANALKKIFETATNVVIYGAGFISLEVASITTKMGKNTSIVARSKSVLTRLFPEILSSFLVERHQKSGANFIFNSTIESITSNAESATAVHLDSGDILPADIVVIGIGTTVNDQLARDAELSCDNGILIDRNCLTSDSSISACGDCASWVQIHDNKPTRSESVQTAVDQAKTIAARLTEKPLPEQTAPWFWTDQVGIKLQMVGDTLDYDDLVVRGELGSDKFSIIYYRLDAIVRIDSINSPADHLAARKLVTARCSVPKDLVIDLNIKLKTLS